MLWGAGMPTIELTGEQQRAVQAEKGQPVEVVDPATRQRYVLLACEQYERVRPLLEQPASSPRELLPRIPPMMLRSMQAYWRELPDLLKLKSRKRQWVGYHAEQRIGFGQTDLDVYRECFQRGLQRGEFYVGKLEAEAEGLPPWGSYESDWSLYESTEVEERTISRAGE
jgi:hypothetical protein